MKRFMFLMAGLVVFALPLHAQSAPTKSWSLLAGVDRSSRYLFRGVALLNEESVIAPRAKLIWGGWGVTYSGYYGKLPGSARYGEGDLAADYTVKMGKAALTLGALTYQFNGNAERILNFQDTYEVYGALSFDVPLTPTLSYNYDVDQVKGGYLAFSLSRSFPLGSKMALNLLGSVGFDFHYNNKDVASGTFNDVLLSADLPIQISDHFSLHAQVQRSIAQKSLDAIARTDSSGLEGFGDQTIVTAGATVTF